MKYNVTRTWKRARDATIVTLFLSASITASGCIGVREKLFQPLPPPSATATSEVGNTPRVLDRAPRAVERDQTMPWPDTRVDIPPPKDSNELLRELDEVEPEPQPLELNHVTIDWRG